LLFGGLLLLLPPLGYLLWSMRDRPRPMSPLAPFPGPPTPPAASASVPPPYGGSLPPSGPGSMPPASARFAPGTRVCVTRNDASHFGRVLKTQQGQAYVELDDGRKVWVAEELLTLA